MRFLKTMGLVGLAAALAACSGTPCQAAAEDIAAATWHFAGGAALANNTNFDNVKKTLTLAASLDFQSLVLTRFSGWLGKSVFLTTNEEAAAALRPLLDDLLSAESLGAAGGAADGPLSFMVALRLDDARAQAWQAALPKAAGGPGQSFQAQGFTGRQWNLPGGQSFWLVRAKDWLLTGGGDGLRSLQTQYLQQISQQGRPAPALKQSWLEADVDWPRLARGLPNFPRLFQLARTKITFTAADQSLFMSATVIYPKPVPWKFEPWRVPTRIIRDRLISFTAGQDIAAFMDPAEPLAKLTDNPLTGQFYLWALGEMGLQSYGAWPVANATNSLQRVSTEAAAAFNAAFKAKGWGELLWQPERKTLIWANLCPILFPLLQVAPETNGQYPLASCFPLELRNKPAPERPLPTVHGPHQPRLLRLGRNRQPAGAMAPAQRHVAGSPADAIAARRAQFRQPPAGRRVRLSVRRHQQSIRQAARPAADCRGGELAQRRDAHAQGPRHRYRNHAHRAG